MIVGGDGWTGVSTPVPGYEADLRYLDHAFVVRPRRARVEDLVIRAQEILEEWLGYCERPYVSFSGGKDSTVLAHLVRSIDPNIPLLYVADEEGCTPDVAAMKKWHTQAEHPLIEFCWGSFFDAYDEFGMGHLAIDRLYSQRVIRWVVEQGYDGSARGLRAQESKARLMHALTHRLIRQRSDSNVWDTDPLLWWKVDDIWAYLALHQLPYSRMYDVDDQQPRNLRRIGTLWGTTAATTGRIARLKRLYPDDYARFVARFPQIASWT